MQIVEVSSVGASRIPWHLKSKKNENEPSDLSGGMDTIIKTCNFRNITIQAFVNEIKELLCSSSLLN